MFGAGSGRGFLVPPNPPPVASQNITFFWAVNSYVSTDTIATKSRPSPRKTGGASSRSGKRKNAPAGRLWYPGGAGEIGSGKRAGGAVGLGSRRPSSKTGGRYPGGRPGRSGKPAGLFAGRALLEHGRPSLACLAAFVVPVAARSRAARVFARVPFVRAFLLACRGSGGLLAGCCVPGVIMFPNEKRPRVGAFSGCSGGRYQATPYRS